MGDRHGNPKKIENFAGVVNTFTSHFGKDDDQTTVTEQERRKRREAATDVAESYYNFASAAYESGWSTHFHYAPFPPSFPPCDSTIAIALAFYEHRLALVMGLKPHMKVLDVGCGIGGPAREIAKFVGCEIVGVCINQTQIDRAVYLTRMEGLQDKCTFVRADFLDLPFAPASFDAAYAIEATVHSPSLLQVYSGVARVLKPGAIFGLSEWVMTPKYDPTDQRHVGMRNRVERGNGVSNLRTSDEAREAMKGAGFEILHEEDFAARFDYAKSLVEDSASASATAKTKTKTKTQRGVVRKNRGNDIDIEGHESTSPQDHTLPSPTPAPPPPPPSSDQTPQSSVLIPFKSSLSPDDGISLLLPAPPTTTPLPDSLPIPPTTFRPWYWPLEGATHLATTWTDYWTAWKMSTWPRRLCFWTIWVGERVGLWDRGVTDAMTTLAYCVDSTAEAGREGIFSPCWWFVGRKVGGHHYDEDYDDDDDGEAENADRDGRGQGQGYERVNANGDGDGDGGGSGKAREDLSVLMY
ncbi:hypothetical protein Z517_08556 [Fonsecaea pedrosoi CBS 271.37]|uniref:Sterol 24-C-methyltransferase n=1 Tax=Fonsecaea pedrosoi CBS 271.37 TaxID=1442368 RepID=A0A0D2EWZ7_9EURO|nr:uncharacterized protein Z517_08556 [Fonsecaea pedrosoi CBS 271.37]KIW78717.1 hypothetical protein Z517_08556 [Fonsecaea pedrosoi CBS 271.37]